MSSLDGSAAENGGLRERLTQKPDAPQKAPSIETASETVKALNREEEKTNKDEKDKKTYGRTLDGIGELLQCLARVMLASRPCNIAEVQPEARMGRRHVLDSMLPSGRIDLTMLTCLVRSLHSASHRGHGVPAV